MNWLLLRGFTRDQRYWGEFPDRMSEAVGSRVVTIDPPGFGSEVDRPSPTTIAGITDDIRARFSAQRGDDAWAILEISLGGMITLDWCARHPEDFQRAVVINTTASDVASLRHRLNPGAALDLILAAFRSPAAVERAALASASNRPSDQLDVIAEQWSRLQSDCHPSLANVRRQGIAAMRFKLPAAPNAPLLVLNSRGDRFVSHRSSDEIARRLGVPIRIHYTAGHDLPLDDPDWVCEQITTWSAGGSR